MKSAISAIIGAIVLILFVNFVWSWGFCRFYVKPGNIAVVTAKEGDPLPSGEILAQEGQRGIQEKILGPGRHFLNPYKYDWEIKPQIVIPPGKVAVVTAKVGRNLPPGEFLAEAGQKGIWKTLLGPGTYALNPYGYEVDIEDATTIPIGYIGVVTSLAGTGKPEGTFAKPGEKGVMRSILQPGLYYINPKSHQVDLIEIGVNQISLSGQGGGEVLTKNTIATSNQAMQELQSRTLATQKAKREDYIEQNHDLAMGKARSGESSAPSALTLSSAMANNLDGVTGDLDGKGRGSSTGGRPAQKTLAESTPEFTLNQHVEFPSRDGFRIQLDMTVEFELEPDKIAGIYRDYGDMPAVVEKILMPQVLSVSRLKGSAYKATDFIAGEGREKFQTELTKDLEDILEAKNIRIHDALVRSVNVPETILEPLQQASIAQEQNLTNKEKQETEKKQGELNSEIQMISQKGQAVEQGTSKLRAEIEAEKNKEVAQIEAEATRKIAAIDRETAEMLADRNIILGEAQAGAVKLVEGEKARGFDLKVKAMGSPQAYTQSEFAVALNPRMKIRILHAGEGTLWTDGKFSQGEAALLNKDGHSGGQPQNSP